MKIARIKIKNQLKVVLIILSFDSTTSVLIVFKELISRSNFCKCMKLQAAQALTLFLTLASCFSCDGCCDIFTKKFLNF